MPAPADIADPALLDAIAGGMARGTRHPQRWQRLQELGAATLRGHGLQAHIEHTLESAAGTKNVDVAALDPDGTPAGAVEVRASLAGMAKAKNNRTEDLPGQMVNLRLIHDNGPFVFGALYILGSVSASATTERHGARESRAFEASLCRYLQRLRDLPDSDRAHLNAACVMVVAADGPITAVPDQDTLFADDDEQPRGALRVRFAQTDGLDDFAGFWARLAAARRQ